MESNKVIHVELKQPAEGQPSHWYFGSMKAVYDHIDITAIGRNYNSLRAYFSGNDGCTFENSKCIIRIGELRRAKANKEK